MAKLTEIEKKILKEKFIKEYAKKKGWNFNKLTTPQMLEIVNKEGYKNPTLQNFSS